MRVQAGRSMVEMLGVLAVMAIISMVGVKMYTNAMNKHRANELIYEAQKRATMVASQILSGRNGLSVAGFTDPAGYIFGAEANPQNANQFNITITGVDSDVCTQMKTAIGEKTPIRHIDDNCTKLTFNTDLSSKNNNNPHVCADNRFTCDTTCCAEDEICNTSIDGTKSCNKLADQSCTSNTWCEKNGYVGKFCMLTGNYTAANGAIISGGTCESSTVSAYTFTNNTANQQDDKTFWISSTKMSYWAAQNFCLKNNKTLVSYNTLHTFFSCDKDKALDSSLQSSACDWDKFSPQNWQNNHPLAEIYWTAEPKDSSFALLLRTDTYHSLKDHKMNKTDGYALCE